MIKNGDAVIEAGKVPAPAPVPVPSPTSAPQPKVAPTLAPATSPPLQAPVGGGVTAKGPAVSVVDVEKEKSPAGPEAGLPVEGSIAAREEYGYIVTNQRLVLVMQLCECVVVNV